MSDTYEPEGGNTPPFITPTPPAPHHVRPVLLVLLGATIIIALSAIALLKQQPNVPTPPNPVTVPTLTVSPKTLTLEQTGEQRKFVATYNGEDVTQRAFWYSDNPAVAGVSDTGGMKGNLNPHAVGTTVVRAVYNELNAEATVTVVPTQLSVSCVARPSTVKVNETVQLVGLYAGLGVPTYTYRWSGTDGITGADGMVDVVYKTVGTKRIHFETTDSVGNIATADCTVEVTK